MFYLIRQMLLVFKAESVFWLVPECIALFLEASWTLGNETVLGNVAIKGIKT